MRTIKSIIVAFALMLAPAIYSQTLKPANIIVAEQMPWFGGVAGVSGTNYFIKIKKPATRLKIDFKNLYAEGNLIPTTTTFKDGFYEIRANYTKTKLPNLEVEPNAGKEDENKEKGIFWLEYTLGCSKKIKNLTIPKFEQSKDKLPLYE